MRQAAAALIAVSVGVSSAWASAAHAASVYRCGAERPEYSDTPCRGGRTLDVADERNAAQREAALAIAHDIEANALKLESARLQAEAAYAPASVLSFRAGPLPPASSADAGHHSSTRRRALQRVDRGFTALVPASASQKNRARKQNSPGSAPAGAKTPAALAAEASNATVR